MVFYGILWYFKKLFSYIDFQLVENIEYIENYLKVDVKVSSIDIEVLQCSKGICSVMFAHNFKKF